MAEIRVMWVGDLGNVQLQRRGRGGFFCCFGRFARKAGAMNE